MRNQLATLQVEEAALLQQLGRDHPKLKDLQGQIMRERELLTGKLGAAELLPDYLETYVAATRHEVAQGEAQLKSLDLLIAEELKAAKSLLRDELKEQSMRQDLARSEKLFAVFVSRIQEINFVKDYGAYNTQVIAPAEEGIQVAPRAVLILALCTFMGLCLGSGAAYAAECSDQSFRSSDEIRERLGLQVVGQVPFVSPDAMDLLVPDSLVDSYISAFHRPKSHVAEAYRSVRTALYFSTHGEMHRLIQVTSASPGDGKSTLACNLAVSIAQSGKRVLLIDADLRRPRIHGLLGIPNEASGLASLALGKPDMTDAVHTTEIGNLWCMPAGGTPDNPAELLTSRRFTDLLEELRQQYDFVIIDTPPMLVVTDPSIVAARVDGVLLTIRPSKNAQNEAVRATDALNAVGANVLGVVVNAVASSKSGGFRHGASGSKLYNSENHHYYESQTARS